MRALWLADVLRDAELIVVEHDGWRGRGWEPWNPRYGIVHATAAPRSQPDLVQVGIVRDGHAQLQGPIANCCVDRQDRWHVLASGQCNTALVGWGGPASRLGNEHLLGVEACNNNGRPGEAPEPWPEVQYESYARGWAAICRQMGWSASRCVGHKQHQPNDKTDPTFDMDQFRRRVSKWIEEEGMPLTDKDAQKVADRTIKGLLVKGISYPGASKDNVRVETALGWSMYRTGLNLQQLREHRKLLEAILAATEGLDTQAILARIDQRAAEDQARDDALLELLEQHSDGSVDAEAVVRRIGELLAAPPDQDVSA